MVVATLPHFLETRISRALHDHGARHRRPRPYPAGARRPQRDPCSSRRGMLIWRSARSCDDATMPMRCRHPQVALPEEMSYLAGPNFITGGEHADLGTLP